MQLTDHMRKHLLDGVIAAQKEDNPLLAGIDLHRLQKTLERDLSEDELFSVMMVVGHNRDETIRAMCLTMIDRATEEKNINDSPQPQQGWRVDTHARLRHLKRLAHRSPRVAAGS